MKRLLLIALLLIVGCSKPINDETLIDKDGKPLKTTKKEKLPVGKDDKLTKAGKRSRAYKDWEKKRDKQEYHYYRKEFYDTFGQEV